MVIYADILILVNFLVDYFLILLTIKLCEYKVKIFRIILSSFVGGLSSLYIFVSVNNVAIDLLYKIFLVFLLTIIIVGNAKFKKLLKFSFVLFCVTTLFGGIIYAFSNIFKTNKLIYYNGIAYLEISPIKLSVLTVIFYFIFLILSKVFKNSAIHSKSCEITVICNEISIELTAIIDSGNSVTDFFGTNDIIISNSDSINKLFIDNNNFNNEKYKKRFRIVPCSTVSGEDILKGYRCDMAIIKYNNEIINVDKPILAKSKIDIKDGFNAIINPNILM